VHINPEFQIHNFYSDLLLSVKTLFDSMILSNKLKTFDFNIANETFSLSRRSYKPNRALPAAIISLKDDKYIFGQPTNNIMNFGLDNINQIRVLWDKKTNRSIYLQEEQTEVSLEILINCESQFQAKELSFHITRYLPKNKFIQLFDFTSFFEIDPISLLNIDMNFNDRPITNLFNKLNKNTGNIEYCYSVNFNPLIRLESISVGISKNVQRTFQVQCVLSYLIQTPLYLVYDDPKPIIKRINIDFNRFSYEPISNNSMIPIISNEIVNKYDNVYNVIRRNLLIVDWNDYKLVNIDDRICVSVYFDKEDFIISPDFKFNIFDVDNKFHENIKPTLVDTDSNEVRFEFNQINFNLFKPNITNPIILQFVELNNN